MTGSRRITYLLILTGFLLATQYSCSSKQNNEPGTGTEAVVEMGFEAEPPPEPTTVIQAEKKIFSEEEVLSTYAKGIEVPLENIQKSFSLFNFGEPLDLTHLNIENTDQMLRLINFIILTDPQVKFIRYFIFGNNYGGGLIARSQSTFYTLLYEGNDENYVAFRKNLGNLIGALTIFKRLIIADLKLFKINTHEKVNETKSVSARETQFVSDTMNYLEESSETPYFYATSGDGTVPKENFSKQFPKLYQGITFSLTPDVELFFTFFNKNAFDFRKLHEGIIPFYFQPRD